MTNIFDENKRKKLEGPEREKEMKPEQTLMNLGLKKGDKMLDVGCGTGFFSVPASKIVGNSGIVYAADISRVMLNELNTKIKKNNIENIKLIHSKADSISINGRKPNFCLLVNILHELDDPGSILDSLGKISAPKSQIAIIDFKKKNTPGGGPSLESRISIDSAKKLLESNSYSVIKNGEISERFYFISAEKKS